jgi:putative membrane protein
MSYIAATLVALVALEHIYILVLEMFLWTTPTGRRAFGMKPEQAEATKVMAANQGLYNGFLAAGLIWGLLHPDVAFGTQIQLFFLGCVLVAGLYGGATASRKIFVIQALPAALAILAVLIAG